MTRWLHLVSSAQKKHGGTVASMIRHAVSVRLMFHRLHRRARMSFQRVVFELCCPSMLLTECHACGVALLVRNMSRGDCCLHTDSSSTRFCMWHGARRDDMTEFVLCCHVLFEKHLFYLPRLVFMFICKRTVEAPSTDDASCLARVSLVISCASHLIRNLCRLSCWPRLI